MSVYATPIVPPVLPLSSKLRNDFRDILVQKGIVTDDTFSAEVFDFWFPEAEEIQTLEDYSNAMSALAQEKLGLSISGAITVSENGDYIYNETWVEVLERLFEQYLSDNPEKLDYVWLPVASSDDIPSAWFHTTTAYAQFRSYTDDSPYTFVSYSRGGWNYYDASSLFLATSDSYYGRVFPHVNTWLTSWGDEMTSQFMDGLYWYASDGLQQTIDSYAYFSRTGEKVDFTLSSEGPAIIYPFTVAQYNLGTNTWNCAGFYVRGCNTDAVSFVPVFKNQTAFISWMTGQGNYYRFNTGYSGGDITVNPDADYSALSGAIADALKQGIANGETMSSLLSRMQSAFSKKLDEINNSLGDISDNTSETNSWLEKIYDLLVKIDKKVSGILIADTVDTAIDLFTKVWDAITDWIEGKLQILDVISEASQITEIIKKKFPFSIPWDIYSILLMFDAPAKPPVIHLHFEFPMLDDYVWDYEYTMDDAAWANLAAFCRFFLTVGYEITLIHWTQKLYASGLFDIPTVTKKKK